MMPTGLGRAQACTTDLPLLLCAQEVRGRSARVQRSGRAGPGLRNPDTAGLSWGKGGSSRRRILGLVLGKRLGEGRSSL